MWKWAFAGAVAAHLLVAAFFFSMGAINGEAPLRFGGIAPGPEFGLAGGKNGLVLLLIIHIGSYGVAPLIVTAVGVAAALVGRRLSGRGRRKPVGGTSPG